MATDGKVYVLVGGKTYVYTPEVVKVEPSTEEMPE